MHVFKHYQKNKNKSQRNAHQWLDEFVSGCLHMYVEEERLCALKAGRTVVLFQLDSFLVQMDIL